jgi:hypothetical protein
MGSRLSGLVKISIAVSGGHTKLRERCGHPSVATAIRLTKALDYSLITAVVDFIAGRYHGSVGHPGLRG